MLFIPQVSFLLAEQITEVAKICVCQHLTDGSTAAAAETDNSWTTTPALVRESLQSFYDAVLKASFLIQRLDVAEFKCFYLTSAECVVWKCG